MTTIDNRIGGGARLVAATYCIDYIEVWFTLTLLRVGCGSTV
jgi:hypothetical protein